jgi:hypothetical protein
MDFHRLTQRDPETRTAVCSVCGPTRMTRNGKSWMCSNKKADLLASWHNRGGRKRYPPSPHALTWRDIELGIGLCPIDGEVAIVPFARGWACKVRATELGGWRQYPALRCTVCSKYDSRHNPVSSTSSTEALCAGCREARRNGPTPRDWVAPINLGVVYGLEAGGDVGAHFVVDADWLNPDWMPDHESAVPGWKTLGAKQ